MTVRNWLMEGTPGATVGNGSLTSDVDSLVNGSTTAADSGGTTTFSNTAGTVQGGTTCMKMHHVPGLARQTRLPVKPAGGSDAHLAVRLYHYDPVTPVASLMLCAARHNAAPAGENFQIYVTTGGAVRAHDASGVSLGATANGAWVAGRRNRIEIVATQATTTTGAIALTVYDGDSNTPTGTLSLTGVNIGTLPFEFLSVGSTVQLSATFTSGDDSYFDSIGINDGGTAEIGPFSVPNTPPTVDAGVNQIVSPSATVNLAADASDAEDSITYAWTWDYHMTLDLIGENTGITGADTATPSFEASASGGTLYRLLCTVSDGTDTDTDTVEVYVLDGDAATILPGDWTGDSGWTIEGAATTLGEALGDGDTGTSVLSPSLSSTPSKRRLRVAPMAARDNLTITLLGSVLTSLVSHANKMRLFAGSTQITQRAVTVTATPDDTDFTLTEGELTALNAIAGGWQQLYVELEADQ